MACDIVGVRARPLQVIVHVSRCHTRRLITMKTFINSITTYISSILDDYIQNRPQKFSYDSTCDDATRRMKLEAEFLDEQEKRSARRMSLISELHSLTKRCQRFIEVTLVSFISLFHSSRQITNMDVAGHLQY